MLCVVKMNEVKFYKSNLNIFYDYMKKKYIYQKCLDTYYIFHCLYYNFVNSLPFFINYKSLFNFK